MATHPRRDFQGPVLLSAGFRPFFLFGALLAAGLSLYWIAAYEGEVGLWTRFTPIDWHIHEFLFGVIAASVAGFLLTAIPNWTGRLPLRGAPLAVLVTAWVAGRLAVSFSTMLPPFWVAVIDLSFLLLLALAAAREIIAGKNWRNLRVLLPVSLLVVANALFHWEAARFGETFYARRLAIAAVLMLIMLIGGRIIPSFTRNWLVRENPGRLPVPFNRFDGVAMVVAGVALVFWVALPDHPATGALLLAAAALHAGRLARWAGERTLRDPLVLVLHVAYVFVPLGFFLTGLAALGAVPPSAGVHAWTIGAMGGMTLAVMSRATMGHTGQALQAGPWLQIAYVMIVIAALGRIAASLAPEQALLLYQVAAIGWTLAYLAFVAGCGRMLVSAHLHR